MLTQDYTDTVLLNAKIELVEAGYSKILDRRNGKVCNCKENILIKNLVYAMDGFVLESTIIDGIQPTLTFTMPSLNVSRTFSMEVTDGNDYAEYSIGVSDFSASVNAQTVVNYINSKFPSPYKYFAQSNGSVVTLSGSDYTEDNGVEFTINMPTNGEYVTQIKTLSGGEGSNQDNNCITDLEAESVMESINTLVSPSESLYVLGSFNNSFNNSFDV